MPENLYGVLKKRKNNMIAFVGMAKNTGKTTALNQAVKEISKAGKNLGILSYGRDGEEFDAITRKQKPSIKIPPDSYFVTAASRVVDKSELLQFVTGLQIDSPVGEINLYKSRNDLLQPLEIELIGVNRTSDLERVKKLILQKCDFVLVDGALDRRSSALPELTKGVILSTGAVLGRNVKHIVEKTRNVLQVFNLPGLSAAYLNNFFRKVLQGSRKDLRGFFYWGEREKIIKLTADTSFDLTDKLKEIIQKEEIKEKMLSQEQVYLVLAGAFTSGMGDFFMEHKDYHNFNLIVKDPTRVFIDAGEIQKLKQRKNISIKMLSTMNLLALTVNPHNPVGRDIASDKIIEKIKKDWPELPIFDVESDAYQAEL